MTNEVKQYYCNPYHLHDENLPEVPNLVVTQCVVSAADYAKCRADRDAACEFSAFYKSAYETKCTELECAEREATRLRAALKAFTETYRVLYNVDQVYSISPAQQQQLEQDLRAAYEQALSGRSDDHAV